MSSIFCIYMLNQVVWLINIVSVGSYFRLSPAPIFGQTSLDELGTGLATSVSTVLVNRLMISVRRHYYGHEHDMDELTSKTTGFRAGRVRASTTRFNDPLNNEYELQDFSEKTGF